MKKTILVTILVIFFFSSHSQKIYGLELNSLIRYDWYKEFEDIETVIGGKNYVQPIGISWSTNVNLIRKINSSTNIHIGVGYYKHTISKIKSHNNIGEGKDRVINFPSPLFIDFLTDKYYYGTVSGNLGFAKQLQLKHDYKLTLGFDMNSLYMFSQYYHLTKNPEGSQDYRKGKSAFFGFLMGVDVGYIKSFNLIDVGPKLKIPIFSSLKKDVVFPNENDGKYRNNWFSGFGFEISFIYKLKTKK